ncbi:MAG: Asp-tRNA(Asn)/Glu-tRNA(Gln) amidotransferase subunit GatC [Patescibacteria group bacterium]
MVSKKLSQEEVEWVAKLAYIALTDAEKAEYTKELSAVLGYVEELGKVDTNQVDGNPSFCCPAESGQITGQSDVMDGDYVRPSEISREEFLKRAPVSEKGYIKVKSVFRR